MTVEEIIQESVKDEKLNQAKMRRRYIYKLLDYYSGSNTANYIASYFDADAFREIPLYEANFTKRFINKMSRIYTVGAERVANKAYDGLARKKDTRMKHVERMTRLVGSVATQVIFREDLEEPCFDYKPVYYFDVHMGDNPYVPEAITYPILQNVNDVSFSEKLQYAYWDRGRYALYSEDGDILEEYDHGYGIIPFLFTHRENQIDSFFVDGADDIVGCNEQVNITLTELQLGLRFQMFGQPYVTGVYSDKGMKRTGSDQILDLPEGSTFGIASPAGDINAVIESVKFQVDLVAQNNHLYVSFAQDGGEVPSGIALKIKDLERFEDYQDDVELWFLYEKELYEIERRIADYNGINLPNKIKIDFNEPDYPKTVNDQILLDNHRLEHNLITEPGLLVEQNNDLTLEEAKAIVKENKQENKQQSIFEKVREQGQAAPRI
tara:strand:- start:3052 stop:4362 length:1311 start_codon:yes stop_codon:yes gene_type:complete